MSELSKAIAPVPLERFPLLPADLSGQFGSNRSTAVSQIEANDDLAAIHCWLSEFEDSPQTYRNYRKEVERLLLWSIKERGKPLSSLTREDFQAYEKFLPSPTPKDYWCGPRADRSTVAWKPFLGPLKTNSQRQALIVINALMSYLVNAAYISGNPLSLMRRRKQKLHKLADEPIQLERFLDVDTWEYLKRYIREMPQDTSRQIATFERTRFLFHILYLLAPRVSEVANHQMNSFREIRGKWWWLVVGKGRKKAKLPVSDEMLDALIRYRRHLKLGDLPTETDDTSLIKSINGTKSISPNMVYRIVKETVKCASASVEDEDPVKASKLIKASTHWFRHTAASHLDQNGFSLKQIKDQLRHEKVETTQIYQHAEDDVWHDEMQRHKF